MVSSIAIRDAAYPEHAVSRSTAYAGRYANTHLARRAVLRREIASWIVAALVIASFAGIARADAEKPAPRPLPPPTPAAETPAKLPSSEPTKDAAPITVPENLTVDQFTAGGDKSAKPAVAKPRPAASRYLVIDIKGVIGQDITASMLNTAIKQAKARDAGVLLLVIDSAGGSPSETAEIFKTLGNAAAADMLLVAHVRRAVGDAAVIALACPKIVMFPEGTLGGIGPESLVGKNKQEIGAGEWSQLKATARAAAELGRHNPLLAEAMIDPDVEIAAVMTKDTEQKLEKVPADIAPEKRVNLTLIKERGKVTTFTANEAVRVGLAAGVAKNEDEVRAALQAPSLRSAGNVNAFMANKARENRREKYLESIAPQLGKIDIALGKLNADRAALQKTLADVRRKYYLEYRDAVARNEPYGEELVNERLGKETLRLRAQIHQLDEEEKRLLFERQKLIDAAPN